MATADGSRLREHRTRDELNRLLHYGHIIPVSKGYTAKFVAENYPGWTWNQLIEVFIAAGIVVNRGGSPPKCDDRVEMFHFSGPTDFLVEWVDGVEPKQAIARRLAADAASGQYTVELGNGVMGFTLGGIEP